jgi:hypothetical protein
MAVQPDTTLADPQQAALLAGMVRAVGVIAQSAARSGVSVEQLHAFHGSAPVREAVVGLGGVYELLPRCRSRNTACSR